MSASDPAAAARPPAAAALPPTEATGSTRLVVLSIGLLLLLAHASERASSRAG